MDRWKSRLTFWKHAKIKLKPQTQNLISFSEKQSYDVNTRKRKNDGKSKLKNDGGWFFDSLWEINYEN